MAVRFDAVGDSLSRTTNLPTASGFSILGWIYPVSFPVTATTGNGIFHYGDTNTKVVFTANVTGVLGVYDGTDVAVGSTLAVNTWYHIAMTYDATNLRAYVNGVIDITEPDTNNPSVAIYVCNDQGGGFFDGRAAAVKVYSAVLSAAEILNEMRQYLPVRTANLNGFYPLLSTADDEIDFSGNANTWTVGGALATADGPGIPWKAGRRRVHRPVAAAAGRATRNTRAVELGMELGIDLWGS